MKGAVGPAIFLNMRRWRRVGEGWRVGAAKAQVDTAEYVEGEAPGLGCEFDANSLNSAKRGGGLEWP